MGDSEQVTEQVEGKVDEPEPDPWAGNLQLASIATAAAGVGGLTGDQSAQGVAPESIALLPDPNQIFTSAAQLLGFQPNSSDVWTWGLVLVIVSLVLNILSFFLYRRSAKARSVWKLATQQAATAKAKSPAQAQGIRRDA